MVPRNSVELLCVVVGVMLIGMRSWLVKSYPPVCGEGRTGCWDHVKIVCLSWLVGGDLPCLVVGGLLYGVCRDWSVYLYCLAIGGVLIGTFSWLVKRLSSGRWWASTLVVLDHVIFIKTWKKKTIVSAVRSRIPSKLMSCKRCAVRRSRVRRTWVFVVSCRM